MWELVNLHGIKFELAENTITTVGRRNCHVILENDNSISKSHANIILTKSNNTNAIDETICTIIDAGSKYGTFLINENNELIQITAKGYRVKSMDKIKFGLQQHIFTMLYTPKHKYFVLASKIYGNERKILAEILESLNGILCDEWNSQCTHLTCPTITLTEKMACALVAGLHIVTENYWYQLRDAERMVQSLPNPKDFIPPFENTIMVTNKISVLPNPARKLLFKDKIFVFFNEAQCKVFSRMIELANGKSVIYDQTLKPADCCKKNIIVIQTQESSQITQSQPDTLECRAVYLRLSQEKLRTIPDSDIPLAILFCSTQQYCNPQFKYVDLLTATKFNHSQDKSSSISIVPETQESIFKYPKNTNKNHIIAESVAIDTQINSQMQPHISCDTHKQHFLPPSQSKLINKNTIIPESEPKITQSSIQMMSQVSHSIQQQYTLPLSSQYINNKNTLISELVPKITHSSLQCQSQESLIKITESSTDSQTQKLNDKKKISGKPRVLLMETVIPPRFLSESLEKNARSSDAREKIPEPINSNEENTDDCYNLNEITIESISKISQIAKKRTLEVQLSPNNNINRENLSAKRRHIIDDSVSNETPMAYIETDKLTKRKDVTGKSEKNFEVLNKNAIDPTSHVFSNHENEYVKMHFFARTNQKCIIPLKRLTLEDMYEWKPNKKS